MAKKLPKNKIGESFEQNLPDDLVPDFIWDNISNTLDAKNVPTESTEKIKTSFEEGFNEAAVPPLLWSGIEASLGQNNVPHSIEQTNKIKTSFETGHQDVLPENLWENVEDQLEIEGVWKRVLKGLNKRTRRQYWQEKGMQFGIVALALLLLRGCDFGEWLPTTPIASESSVTTIKTKENAKESMPVLVADSKIKSTNLVSSNASAPRSKNTNPSSNNSLLEETYRLTNTPVFSKSSGVELKANSKITSPPVAKKTNASIFARKESKQQHFVQEEKLNTPSLKGNGTLDNTSTVERKEIKKNPNLSNSILANEEKNTSNKVDKTSSKILPTTLIALSNTREGSKPAQNTLVDKTTTLLKHSIKGIEAQETDNINPLFSRDSLSETPILTLKGETFVDPAMENIYNFEIDNVANKKKHNIRFELGMNGKVGTSLLLGNATNRAMETTSMVKTKMRAAGSVGIILDCYLTANDAIVFGAYPLSNSQQYFGGYTNEGRYYHKEVKLAYFDFTLGYQRTLLHYNDFGTVPSSMYARLDYGLGYLSKSEEVINGLAAELGDSYNKVNHNIGLTIGNTHRINRFVIDYGIYGNLGLSSVQNTIPSGTSSVEYNNLATMGGYLGLRYVL